MKPTGSLLVSLFAMNSSAPGRSRVARHSCRSRFRVIQGSFEAMSWAQHS